MSARPDRLIIPSAPFEIGEAYLAMHPAKPTVAERVRRLNPKLREGDRIRGRFFKPAPWRLAKKRWQAGVIVHFPFMAPGGKRIVSPMHERLTPGDFLPGGRAAR